MENRIPQTFEEFLQDMFINLREVGGMAITKDNCEDMFDNWLCQLDGEEYIKWGDLFGKSRFLEGQAKVLDKII